jgi:hypothetical protein
MIMPEAGFRVTRLPTQGGLESMVEGKRVKVGLVECIRSLGLWA